MKIRPLLLGLVGCSCVCLTIMAFSCINASDTPGMQ